MWGATGVTKDTSHLHADRCVAPEMLPVEAVAVLERETG